MNVFIDDEAHADWLKVPPATKEELLNLLASRGGVDDSEGMTIEEFKETELYQRFKNDPQFRYLRDL